MTTFTLDHHLRVTLIPSTKYKTVGIAVKFIADFDPQRTNERLLVGRILCSKSKKYPSKRLLQQKLDDMYGTQVTSHVSRIGFQSVSTIQAWVISSRYMNDVFNLPLQAMDLLEELLFYPYVDSEGYFDSRVCDEELRLHKEEIEAIYHDKFEYSFQQFKKVMFHGELFQSSAKGDLETLDKVSKETLKEVYNQMMTSDEKELFIVGDFDEEMFHRHLLQRFRFTEVLKDRQWIDTEGPQTITYRDVEEFNDLSQTRISIGYRTPIQSDHPLRHAMSLFSVLMGESDQSILFQEIREKSHLCYYISSIYSENKGAFFVFAGVDDLNRLQAKNQMLTLISPSAIDAISEDQIDLAKKHLIHRIQKQSDNMHALMNLHFSNMKLHQSPYNPLSQIAAISAITKDELREVAKALRVDTAHTLRNGDAHENHTL